MNGLIFRAFFYASINDLGQALHIFSSKIVVFLFDILDAEAIEAAKSRAALSALLEE
jgi:hypothetical protein